ncbi:hypothetical protein KGQ19_45695 [Catenulispora sp. NL8]|uniref:Uncharacterized protein n=1 Tax=Catenulispora pinistramenti TaxID=2705254 RepID=A0ABS5L765_9ACTN|nr:hypothetical protein [Catenulispora pinistramenti]MBS2554172.1 hypothetical protein [Catenulispora pinistramenti]
MADTAVPDRDAMRSLAAALGDQANALAADGRVAEVRALWEDAIARLPDEASRARLTLAYAWYQALHGEVEHGIGLAAGLRECPVSPVLGQIRVLVRGRARDEPEAVERAWRAVTGSGLPDWADLTDEAIELTAEWVVAASWAQSKELFDSRVEQMGSRVIDMALQEIELGAPGLSSLTAIHRAVLALGGTAGYRALSDPRQAARVAAEAIAAGDWEALRACGTIERKAHGRAFLGGTHGVAADLMTGGDLEIGPAMAERVAGLAADAEPWERRRAVEDLAAIGDGPAAPLLALVAAIP